MKRQASATWTGNLQDGKGSISTATGTLSGTPYGFKSRFEDGPGTSPEELIAAAHAGCFSMALSLLLGKNGLTPERIETRVEVTLVKDGEGFSISSSHLDVVAKVPATDEATFLGIAKQAKEGCPVSKVLNATITMDARLQS